MAQHHITRRMCRLIGAMRRRLGSSLTFDAVLVLELEAAARHRVERLFKPEGADVEAFEDHKASRHLVHFIVDAAACQWKSKEVETNAAAAAHQAPSAQRVGTSFSANDAPAEKGSQNGN